MEGREKREETKKPTNAINRTNERKPRQIPRRADDLRGHCGVADGHCVVVGCAVYAAGAIAYAEGFVDSA